MDQLDFPLDRPGDTPSNSAISGLLYPSSLAAAILRVTHRRNDSKKKDTLVLQLGKQFGCGLQTG